MAVKSNITAENEDRTYLIIDGVLAGLKPVEGSNFVMLTNGGRAIFIPATKDLSNEQKCVYMGAVAKAAGLDFTHYRTAALAHPERIPELLSSLHNGVISGYRNAIENSGRNNDPAVMARIENVRRNNLLLTGIMEYVGFPKGLAQEASENVNASLDIIQKYAESHIKEPQANAEESGRE